MTDTNHFWLDELIGREAELDALFKQHYQVVKETHQPRIVCLIAESGVGKTRLLREFYMRLLTEEDASGYWPTTFSGDLITLDLNPDFSEHNIPEQFSPNTTPFIWWAVRFSSNETRNRPSYSSCALLRGSSALLLHLNYLAKNRLLSKDKKKALDLLFDVAVEFGPKVAEVAIGMAAPPWSGIVGLCKSVALKCHEAVKQRRELMAISEALSNPGGAMKQDALNFQKKLLTGLEAMLAPGDRSPRMPMIMVLDDIHWADPASVEILQAVLEKSSKERWPLLVLATVWPAPWDEAGLDASDTPLAGLRTTFRAVSQSGTASLHEIRLARIDDAASIVDKGLPGLTEHQRTALLGKFKADLFALDQCVDHFRGRPKLFVDRDIAKALTGTGESALNGFPHPRLEIIQKRFETLETEIQDVLGRASYQGFNFLGQLVVDVTRRIIGSQNKDGIGGVTDALGRAESPVCFIQRVSPRVARFVDPANFQVVNRWLSEVPEDVESVRKATLDEIDAWMGNGSLLSLSLTELDDFLMVARHVLEDAQSTIEIEGASEQLTRLQGELAIVEMFLRGKTTGVSRQIKGLTHEEVRNFANYRGRLPLAWQAEWLVGFESSLFRVSNTPRQVIEALRPISLIMVSEAVSRFAGEQGMDGVNVIKDVCRAAVGLTTSLFNIANIDDPAWKNPENEWDFQYKNRARTAYRDNVSSEVVSVLDTALSRLPVGDNPFVRVARLRVLREIELMAGASETLRAKETKRTILQELLFFPENELGRDDVLENLFDGVLPDIMYGYGYSDLQEEALQVITRLIKILEPLDYTSAGTFQLVTLACASQVFGDRDMHLDEDSAPYFEKAFELSLEIIRRGLVEIVLDWLCVSARISCAATFRGNEGRRWQARRGSPAPDFLSRGWTMAKDTVSRISEVAEQLNKDQLDSLHIRILGAMSRFYLSPDESPGFNGFFDNAKEFLGNQIQDIHTQCAYIWSLNALNASINRPSENWNLLESAYRVAFLVPPAFFESQGHTDQHNKFYEAIEFRGASAPKEDSLFRLTASVCVDLFQSCGHLAHASRVNLFNEAIINLIKASATLAEPYNEWAEPVVKDLECASLEEDEPTRQSTFSGVQSAWKEYLRHVEANEAG